MSHVGYLDLSYKPDYKKEIIATFYLEAACAFPEAADAVAGESSIGSWADLSTMKPKTADRLKARVFSQNK
jgi:ribulose-bisphosphate carboxylase large chain